MTPPSEQHETTPSLSDADAQARFFQRLSEFTPHYKALGIEVLDAGAESVHARVPYREDFLGDRAAGLWHTSVATTLADSVCGLAVFLALGQNEAIATLDLRMDYLRPAVAGEALHAVAECHHITRGVVFVRASLHQGERARPTALCTAAFMRTGGRPLP